MRQAACLAVIVAGTDYNSLGSVSQIYDVQTVLPGSVEMAMCQHRLGSGIVRDWPGRLRKGIVPALNFGRSRQVHTEWYVQPWP